MGGARAKRPGEGEGKKERAKTQRGTRSTKITFVFLSGGDAPEDVSVGADAEGVSGEAGGDATEDGSV